MPDHAREAFRSAVKEGWIRIVRGAHVRDIARVQDEHDALSDTDAELLLIAAKEGDDLFTDDRGLIHAARTRGVTTYDVADTLALLDELGELDDARLREIVHEMSKERTFTRDDLTLLGIT